MFIVQLSPWKPWPQGVVGRPDDKATSTIRVILFGAPAPLRDLGTVPPSAKREVSFELVNEEAEAVTVGERTTSCECLGVVLENLEVPARGAAKGKVVLDLEKAPNFRGGLILTAEGKSRGDTNRSAFTIRFTVEVK